MCGTSSAIGLAEAERQLWPQIKERLRRPGHLMALMRGVLGDTEVAVAVAVTPQGIAHPLALLATPGIAEEIRLADGRHEGLRAGWIGDYAVDVLVDPPARGPDWRDAEPGHRR